MTTRADLRRRGEAMQQQLFHGRGRPGQGPLPAGFAALLSEAVYGGVWRRPGLALADRMICTLAALAAVQRLNHVRHYTGAALDLGLSARAIFEVLIQIGIYAGFPASEEAIAAAQGVFAERGVHVDGKPPPDEPLEALDRRGRELMQRLHGERGQQGYAAPDNPVTGALYPMAIQYGYGAIWFRPGLDLRRRALVAVAAFTALKLDSQVQKFGQSALNVGLSRTEVIEAVVQTAPYSGFAPALNALGLLSQALR